MTISRVRLICPECRREYTNHLVSSCNGGMLDKARDFFEKNKPTVNCEDCGVRLVDNPSPPPDTFGI